MSNINSSCLLFSGSDGFLMIRLSVFFASYPKGICLICLASCFSYMIPRSHLFLYQCIRARAYSHQSCTAYISIAAM